MVNGSRAESAKHDSPEFYNDVAAQVASLLNADTAAIIDLRAFHAPHPLTASSVHPTPTVSPPPPEDNRPSIRRQQSGLSSGEWYTSSVGKAGRVSGETGTVSVMGSAGCDWASRLRGAAASISHFFITYYSVSLSHSFCARDC